LTKCDRSLAVLYLSVFVAVLGFSLVSPIFPLYVIDLGASYTLLGIIISVYGAVQLLTQIPSGRLSDRIGRKPLILVGMLSFSLLAPLYVEVSSAYWLIPIRVFTGLGSALVWPIAMALIIDQVGRFQRGWAMGWYNASIYSALAVGPAIGGGLYDIFGIKAPFYFWSLLTFASFFIVLTQVEDAPQSNETECEEGCSKESLILPGYWVTFVACCGTVMWAGLMSGFNMTLLPSYAAGLNFSTTEIGLLYFALAGSTTLSNVHFGKVSDRKKRKPLILAGCALGALSFFQLTTADGIFSVMLVMAFLGMSIGMINPAASAMIADITNPMRRGEIFGIFNTARMLGMVLGPLISGIAADLYDIGGAIMAFVVIAALITAGTTLLKESERDF